MKKFGKNREVDSKWLNVPIKYMLQFTDGSNVGTPSRSVPMTIKEEYEDYLKNFTKWDDDDEPIEVCLAEKPKYHICYMKEVTGEVTAITERLFLELLYKGYPIIKQTEMSTIIQNYFSYVGSER